MFLIVYKERKTIHTDTYNKNNVRNVSSMLIPGQECIRETCRPVVLLTTTTSGIKGEVACLLVVRSSCRLKLHCQLIDTRHFHCTSSDVLLERCFDGMFGMGLRGQGFEIWLIERIRLDMHPTRQTRRIKQKYRATIIPHYTARTFT